MSHSDTLERPSVGVAVVVIRDGKVLVGRDLRKGEGLFGVPGGHWESGETLKDTAIREVQEESGVQCSVTQLISVYDFYREDKQKSYVTIGFAAEYVSGDVSDLPAEGRMEWKWYTPEDALKLPLFPPDKILLERFVSGEVFPG